MKANYIKKEPVWYHAVLDYPPISLPAKQPPTRSDADQKPNSKSKRYSVRPLPVHYLEDDVRRQFFRDQPFEAFRPTSLVENDVIEAPNPISGESWTRLRQWGRNPTPEEYAFLYSIPHSVAHHGAHASFYSAVKFAVNLHQHHEMSLSDAYAAAVAQFHALRSEHHIASTIAGMEAEYLGSSFGPSELELQHEKEKQYLAAWGDKKQEKDQGVVEARKRWKAIIDKKQGVDQWTKGEEYVRLWRQGIRPDYSPALTAPVEQQISRT